MAAAGLNLSVECKTYYRSGGTWGTPIYTEIVNMHDLDYAMAMVWHEVTTRGSNRVKQFVKTLREWSPTWDMVEDFSDTVFVALQLAALNTTVIEFFLCSGPFNEVGNIYLRFDAQVEMAKTEPLDGVGRWKTTIKPTYSDNDPGWGIVA